MRPLLLPVVLLASLACSGLIPTDSGEPAAPEGDAAGREVRTGEPSPATIVAFAPGESGLCEITRTTLPGGEVTPLGAFGPKCPRTALVTWTGDRVVITDDRGAWTDGTTGRPEEARVPSPPQVVVFGDAGVLHACAKLPARAATEKDDATMAFEWEGKAYEAEKLDGAKTYVMWVHWTLVDAAWKVVEASLEGDVEPPEVPVCQRLPDFPKDDPWVSSEGPEWTVSDWREPTGPDVTLLAAVHDGAWRIDPSRTIAVVGKAEDQRFVPESNLALWLDGAWKQVHADVDTLWLEDDWVAVEDGGELDLLSRRDGTVAWKAPAEALAFPWPGDAPDVAVPVPEAVPEAEPEVPEGKAGDYVPGSGEDEKAGKGTKGKGR